MSNDKRLMPSSYYNDGGGSYSTGDSYKQTYGGGDPEVISYFGVPILTFKTPFTDDFNEQLIDTIYQLEKDMASVDLSNVGGWHSEYFDAETVLGTKFAFYLEQVRQFCSSEMGREYISPYEVWININRNGDSNSQHTHPFSIISGVYYAKIPEGDFGGIVFEDPIQSRIMQPHDIATPQVEFKPEVGTCLLFPSWLSHYVRPNNTHEDRISVAFNLRTTEFVK